MDITTAKNPPSQIEKDNTMTTAPALPASVFTAEQLEKSLSLSKAGQEALVTARRERGELSEDGTQFAVRDYRYSKAGVRSLVKETWVPIVDAPETPEAAWDELGTLATDIEDAEWEGNDATLLREIALQVAAAGVVFVTVALGFEDRRADLSTVPEYAVGAFAELADFNDARAAVMNARDDLALGRTSISKVLKLVEAEKAAADRLINTVIYAIDGATGWQTGSLDRIAPDFADVLRLVARNAHAHA